MRATPALLKNVLELRARLSFQVQRRIAVLFFHAAVHELAGAGHLVI